MRTNVPRMDKYMNFIIFCQAYLLFYLHYLEK